MVIVYEECTSPAVSLTTTVVTSCYRHLLNKNKLKTCVLTWEQIQQSLVAGSRPKNFSSSMCTEIMEGEHTGQSA
jgi:hypothetical protein